MLRPGAIIALFLCLSGCSLGERGEASRAIARVLDAADRGDRAAFEAGVDRAALRADLADQMADLGKTHGLDIAEAPTEFVLDRLVNPAAVRQAALRTAPGWPARPTAEQIVPHMKVRDRTHVCLEAADTKACLLTFAKRGGAGRLVAMPASALQARPLRPQGAGSP